MCPQDDLSMVEDVCKIDSYVSYFFDESFPMDPLTPLLDLSTIDIALAPPYTNNSNSFFSDLSSPIRHHSICNTVSKLQLVLKQLPSDLKYTFLDFESQFSVIIASDLSPQQKELGALLRNHKSAISWSLDDIHSFYVHPSYPFRGPSQNIERTAEKP